ncbi:hypothetical protein Kpho02_74170 [Kitasatospora phosalacinea]|uniref:Uncharacterized protein n=1 Tax=Kitasatospora phosalacinea TaxID=2065 RepID=A0A9W6QDF1_9ACTN|nr:hypothetical protein Kpho02_74170 [Kitasatospora phosalacinea]
MSPCVRPPADNDSTISPTPVRRRWRFLTVCGSKLSSRSGGTSIRTGPTSVSEVVRPALLDDEVAGPEGGFLRTGAGRFEVGGPGCAPGARPAATPSAARSPPLPGERPPVRRGGAAAVEFDERPHPQSGVVEASGVGGGPTGVAVGASAAGSSSSRTDPAPQCPARSPYGSLTDSQCPAAFRSGPGLSARSFGDRLQGVSGVPVDRVVLRVFQDVSASWVPAVECRPRPSGCAAGALGCRTALGARFGTRPRTGARSQGDLVLHGGGLTARRMVLWEGAGNSSGALLRGELPVHANAPRHHRPNRPHRLRRCGVAATVAATVVAGVLAPAAASAAPPDAVQQRLDALVHQDGVPALATERDILRRAAKYFAGGTNW